MNAKQKQLIYFQFVIILLLLTTISCSFDKIIDKECSTKDTETRIKYEESSSNICQSETQTRSCINHKWGNWDGNFIYEQCLIIPSTSINDSPFGVMVIGEEFNNDFTNIKDIKNNWVRLSGIYGLIWEKVETEKGNYDWSIVDNFIKSSFDERIKATHNNAKLMVNIAADNSLYGTDHGHLPKNMNAYKEFLKRSVEKYPQVEVWQIGNEIDLEKIEWKDTLENYALLLKESYKTIKLINPNAKVAIAGMAHDISDYREVLSYFHNDEKYFDIFDFHWHAQTNNSNYLIHYGPDGSLKSLDTHLLEIKSMLDDYGHADTPIWVTELSSGSELFGETEKTHASQLIKNHIYLLGNNIKNLIWPLYENPGFGGDPDSYFGTHGLINDPKYDGKSYRKLSYYTYKLMIEKLDGSDWNNIETIQNTNNIYIYRFINKKTNNSILVAWNDNVTKTVTINNLSYFDQVLITDAIPNAIIGSQLDTIHFPSFFKFENKTIVNNKLEILLGESPVFIESSN